MRTLSAMNWIVVALVVALLVLVLRAAFQLSGRLAEPVSPQVAAVFPCWAFYRLGRPFAATLALGLQLTAVGWVIAAVWATSSVNRCVTDQRIQGALDASSQVRTPHSCANVPVPRNVHIA